jgi:hypothetical protein
LFDKLPLVLSHSKRWVTEIWAGGTRWVWKIENRGSRSFRVVAGDEGVVLRRTGGCPALWSVAAPAGLSDEKARVAFPSRGSASARSLILSRSLMPLHRHSLHFRQ